jgi:hypothetical protein
MQAGIEPARDEVAARRVPISPLHEILGRAERFELPFSPPFTDRRFAPGVGYARMLAALPGIEQGPAGSEPAALSLRQRASNGQGGWIRTNALLLPRQAGTTGLPYTLMTGLPGRSRTCILRVRSAVLIRLSYGKSLESRNTGLRRAGVAAGFTSVAVRLDVFLPGCLTIVNPV